MLKKKIKNPIKLFCNREYVSFRGTGYMSGKWAKCLAVSTRYCHIINRASDNIGYKICLKRK